MIVLLLQVSAFSQGTFQNLDFEQATIVSIGLELPYVWAADAIPYWTPYEADSPQNAVFHDDITLGSPMVSIHDSASPWLQPLEGNYSIALQHSTGGQPTTVAVGQTGQLPVDALSLIFYAFNRQNLQVTFSGNVIPFVQLGIASGYSILGGDISSYSGQTGELKFTHTAASSNWEMISLDRIQFSDQRVPEPGALNLLAIGGVIFGWKLRRK